ncbi:hypothetical protein N7456_006490 [Penicillium angulare]|uniref:Uncharacterized protein n=1 Tax=Penicillium angulare TaxID=116970 RepID=A0A9W9KBZ6_9EURO|nr:hypothetical protein N7456_006490 [Penicillium angulare]
MTTTTPLPLTTTFSPPEACMTDTWFIEYVSGINYYTEIITGTNTSWWLSLGPTKTSTCFPSGYQTNTDFYYSPGVCPSGYWIAQETVLTTGTETETRGTCCPNNYQAQTETNLAWYTHNACTSYNPTSTQVWKFTKAGTTSSTTRADGINAPGISIRWKEGEVVPQTSTFASSTSIATAPTATEDPTPPESNGGLSTGAKIGIGVGVAVGGIVIIALLAFFCLYRRKNKSSELSGSENPRSEMRPVVELSDNYRPAELQASFARPVEMDGHGQQSDLYTRGLQQRWELDTGPGKF